MRPLLCLLALSFASLSLSCKGDPSPPPPPPVCGNGMLEDGETCEGTPMPPEGCDPTTCTVVMGWACTPEPPSPGDTGGGVTEPMEWTSTCEELDTCGDGVIDTKEDCDDGNLTVMDGCSGCRVDPLYTCTGQPSQCHTCGDGFRNPGEQCDDAELLGYDSPGCVNCNIVPGWVCFPGQGQFDLCGPACGDGLFFDTSIPGVTIGFAEQCDDGNLVDGDGCNASCRIEAGWMCSSVAPATSVCSPVDDTTGTETDTSGSDTDTSSSSDTGSGSDTGGSTG
jgi:large repetitive protein